MRLLRRFGRGYKVFGDHTYTDEGTYDIAVTITEESATTTFHTTATMVDELLPDSSRPSVPVRTTHRDLKKIATREAFGRLGAATL